MDQNNKKPGLKESRTKIKKSETKQRRQGAQKRQSKGHRVHRNVDVPVILVTPPRAAQAPTIAYKPGVTHVCPLLHISLNM